MIVRSGVAAALCDISTPTLWRWTCEDPRVKAAKFKRGYYVAERLAAAGLCPLLGTPEFESRLRDSRKASAA